MQRTTMMDFSSFIEHLHIVVEAFPNCWIIKSAVQRINRNYTQVQENDRPEWLRNDLQTHWEDIFVSFKQYSHKNTKTANVSTMSWPSHLNICSVSNWTNVKSSDLPFLSGEIVPTLWSCFEIQIRSYIDAQKHSSYIMLHKYRVMQ